MPVIVYLSNISSYFNNIIAATKLNDFHSYSIAVSLHYLSTEIKGHNDNYQCHCFKCLVYRSLWKTLLSGGYENIIFIKSSGVANIILM